MQMKKYHSEKALKLSTHVR